MARHWIVCILALAFVSPPAGAQDARQVPPVSVQYVLAAEQIELGEGERLLVPGQTAPNVPVRARGIYVEALPNEAPFDLLVGFFGTGTHDVTLRITRSGSLLWSARYPTLTLDEQDFVHKAILARVQLPRRAWRSTQDGPPVAWVEVWVENKEIAAFPWWTPLHMD